MSTSSSPSDDSESEQAEEDDQYRQTTAKGGQAASKRKGKRRNFVAGLESAPTLFNAEQNHHHSDFENLKLDESITFASVGGHEASIRVLKEMIIFPFIYADVFTRFKIKPPRGVLFHGPPGTGKTLLARALANECSKGAKKVSFFMRKGADCLSKWVGESERQLKNIFEKAYAMRPSIIFFDEIDGLAPVRSSRQDQIHASIVSTLLALMDGVDSDNGVVIVGATNRLDFIDPALRRPGRFDREFFFGLPKMNVREAIIRIHTKEWEHKPSDAQISELAEKTNGFCGADLEALCRDSVLHALRRTYPQVYRTNKRLRVNANAVEVMQEDFDSVLATLSSSVMRTSSTYAVPLPNDLKCLLQRQVEFVQASIITRFPVFGVSDYDQACVQNIDRNRHLLMATFRPRILIAGHLNQGASTYIAPALLHGLEINVYAIDPETLFSPNYHCPEQAITHQFKIGSRNIPSVVYLPKINCWWNQLSETAQVILINCVEKLNPRTPLLLLATSSCPFDEIPLKVQSIFDRSSVFDKRLEPDREQRDEFLSSVFQTELAPLFNGMHAAVLEDDVADGPDCESEEEDDIPEKAMSKEELNELWEQEEAVMMSLRLFLREMLSRFVHDRRFGMFRGPVDPAAVPDYYDIIKVPVDLSLIMSKIDKHNYFTVDQFLDDIKLLLKNANTYNPDASPADRELRHKAGHLLDFVLSTVRNELHIGSHNEVKRIFQTRLARGAIRELPLRYILYRVNSPDVDGNRQSPSNSLSTGSSKVFVRFEPVVPTGEDGRSVCVLREDEFNVQQTEPNDDCPIYKRILTIEPEESSATSYFECIPPTTTSPVSKLGPGCIAVNHCSRTGKNRIRTESARPRGRDCSIARVQTSISESIGKLSGMSEKCCSCPAADTWSLDRLQQFKSRLISAAACLNRKSLPVLDRIERALQAIELVVDEYLSVTSSNEPLGGVSS